MVATDTMVGIIGAVVLVAVMVGVFIYEYNNEAEPAGGDGDGAMTDEELMQAFTERYPTLNATEDIDGDDTPNWKDPDVDDDGMNNTVDNMTMVVKQVDGTISAQQSEVATESVFIGTGGLSIEVSIQPATSPSQLPWSICFILENPDGDAAPQDCGNSGALTQAADNPLPGAWEIRLSQQNPVGTPATYTGTYTIMYGTAADHEEHA